MRGWFLVTAWCGTVGLLGCGAGLVPESHASLQLTPALGPASRTIQAVVTPYTRSDVATLVIRLFALDGATESEVATRTLAAAELDRSIAFANLRAYRTYRARGFAYQGGGALISEAELSYVDIPVGNEETPAVGILRIQLLAKTFDGHASSAPIAVTDGGLVPAGIETLGGLRPRIPGP